MVCACSAPERVLVFRAWVGGTKKIFASGPITMMLRYCQRLSSSQERIWRRSVIQEEQQLVSQEGLQHVTNVVYLLGKLQVSVPVLALPCFFLE